MISEAEVEALLPEQPSFIRTYVEHCRLGSASPLAFQLGCGLAILGAMAPQSYKIAYARTWVFPSLYVLLVGPSGDGMKSSAVGTARALLHMAAPEIEAPYPGSTEALIDSLAEKPRQVLFVSEMGKFLSQTQAGYMETTKTTLTDIWDGIRQERMKVTGKSTKPKEDPRLGIISGCSYSYLSRHTSPEDWDGGFLGRWLMLDSVSERSDPYPEYTRTPEVVNQHTEGLVNFLVHRYKNTPQPPTGMSSDALALWREWYESLRTAKFPSKVAGLKSRAPAMALRICLILGMDYGGAYEGPWRIERGLLRNAIAITDLYLLSAMDLGAKVGETGMSRETKQVVEILNSPLRTPPDGLTFEALMGLTQIRRRNLQDVMDGLTGIGAVEIVRSPGGASKYRLVATG